jgi:heme/copper-type cytochrome/quinol oxidase subunit 3
MDRKAAKARIRQEWEEEVRESEEQERTIERQLRKWILATALLGAGFTATTANWFPMPSSASRN